MSRSTPTSTWVLYFLIISCAALTIPSNSYDNDDQVVSARDDDFELVPISSRHPAVLQKRQVDDAEHKVSLDLLDSESFYWGGEGDENLVLANLTLVYKDDYEFVIGMERFETLLKTVTCGKPLVLEFKDATAFVQANRLWNWVNDDVNNTFILVSDRCGEGDDRQPFVVHNIRFEPPSFRALLDAEPKEWTQVAKTYSLHIGYAPSFGPANNRSTFDRRGPDFTMSLTSSFNRNLFHQKVSGVDFSVDCTRCGTSGRILVDFDLDVGFHKPRLSMKVKPKDVAAFLQLSMSAKGTLSKAWRWEKTLVSIPIQGVKIPKIGKIGAFLDVEVGFSVNEWSGAVETSFGANMALSDAAVIEVDVFDLGNGKFSGWGPALTALPFNLGAKVDGSVELYAQPSISISASALDHGLELSLDLRMPYVEVDFSAMANTAGVCGTKKTIGVDLDASAGVDLSVQVAKTGQEANPLWEKTLFDKSWPLYSHCYAFGPDNAGKGGSGGSGGGGAKKPKTQKPKLTPKPKPKPKPKPTNTPVSTLKPKKPKTTTKSSKPKSSTKAKSATTKHKPTLTSSTLKSTSVIPKPTSTKAKPSTKKDKPPQTSSTSKSKSMVGTSKSKPATSAESTRTAKSITTVKSTSTSKIKVDTSTVSSQVTQKTTSSARASERGSSTGGQTSPSPASQPTTLSATTKTTTFSTITSSSSSSSSACPTNRIAKDGRCNDDDDEGSCPITYVDPLDKEDLAELVLDDSSDPGSDPPVGLSDLLVRANQRKRRGIKHATFLCDGIDPVPPSEFESPYPIPSKYQASGFKISPWFHPSAALDLANYEMTYSASRPSNTCQWATEHVYEASWIPAFLLSLSATAAPSSRIVPNQPPGTLSCQEITRLFFNPETLRAAKEADFHPPTPEPLTTAGMKAKTTFGGEIFSQLGSSFRQDRLLMLSPHLINTRKNRLFDGSAIIMDSAFTSASAKQKMETLADVGRAMRYMADPKVGEVMNATASGIEEVLIQLGRYLLATEPEGDVVKKLTAGTGAKYGERFLAVRHREWLKSLFVSRNEFVWERYHNKVNVETGWAPRAKKQLEAMEDTESDAIRGKKADYIKFLDEVISDPVGKVPGFDVGALNINYGPGG